MISVTGFRLSLLCGGLLLLCPSVIAAPDNISVVRGNFIYGESKQTPGGEKISYQVEAAVYQGVNAWRIAWNCDRIDAVHYIRRSDGAPLYVKRTNHILDRTVEVTYSLDPSIPHIYRRDSRDETVIRRIRQADLKDMGALPQLLSGFQASQAEEKLYFSSIDYDDGQVHALMARRIGYATVNTLGEAVHCAIYEINLDSWKAAFNPSVRILVPTRPGLSNFAMYSGPDPAGSGEQMTLRMLGRDADMAALHGEAISGEIR